MRAKLRMIPRFGNAEGSGPNMVDDDELDELLYARHAEIMTEADLLTQRGTPIPALFNQFYKFIQNPSTVSVETFKRMVDTDDTVGSGVDFLTTCLAARLGRFTHPDKQIEEFINKALAKLDGGFTNAVKELLGATWAGFSVAEQVWANDPLGFIIKRLVTLPPGSILFETERTGELTPDGILQYQRNYNPANLAFGTGSMFGFSSGGTGAGSRNDPYAKYGDFPFPIRSANTYSYLSIRIPVQKCVHYAFDAQGKFGNPYGRSLLRRGYKWYVMKDAFLQMLSVALDRKGTPLTLVYADPNVTLKDGEQTGPNPGNVRGRKVGMPADEAARRAFANVHNDSTIILPGKKGQIFDTDFVPQTSNAGDFISAIQLCDKGLLRSLLIPSLIFGNGDGSGSFALGETHAKTFDKLCDGMLGGFKQTLLCQLIEPMVRYNFPAIAYETVGMGDFAKEELSPDDRQKETGILSAAITDGAIDMNDLQDLNTYRSIIRFPARTKPIEKPMEQFGPDGELLPPGEEGEGGEGGGEGEGGKPGKPGEGKGKPPAADEEGGDE